MKKIWKIVSRVLLTVGLVLYVAVALLNYSVVQSVLGTMAGKQTVFETVLTVLHELEVIVDERVLGHFKVDEIALYRGFSIT